MTNLPINISNVPAKVAASKPSNNEDVAQQDGQDFGNVLTRQVADADKPAASTPSSSGDEGKEPAKQLSEKDKVETTPVADASSLPADMLAALLAQQNPTPTPQPDVNLQAALNAQIVASTPVTSDMKAVAPATAEIKTAVSGVLEMKADAVAPAAAGMKALVSTVQDGDNSRLADTALPGSDATRPKAESAVQDNKGFAETLKASFDAKESASTSASQALRGAAISELASTAQQAFVSAPVATTAAPASPISISTPVTQPAWGDEFGQKITWMATQRNQSAELHLNPPQLGPLDVVLKVNGDQATAMFTSPHAAVRDAIEQALPKLREMLADNGIMLGNAMVSDQPARNDQDGSSRKSQGSAPISGNAPEAISTQGARISTLSRHNGMVDTFA